MSEKAKKSSRNHILLVLLAVFAAVLTLHMGAGEVKAAAKGFRTVKGKTYYIDDSGKKHKGWLNLNGKKYYFNKKTGVQVKGWQLDSKGRRVRYFSMGKGIMATGFVKDKPGITRYFSPANGRMVTGWMKDANGYRYYFKKDTGAMLKGWVTVSGRKRYFSGSGRMATGWVVNSKQHARYFSPKSGFMYTGLQKVDGAYYYFVKSTGFRYQKGFYTISKKKYYFNPTDGRAQIGWLTLNGKTYYFNSKGVMYTNTTAVIDGISYKFSSSGVASQVAAPNVVANDKTMIVYDEKNARNYTVMKEYLSHPGVANGEKSDLDLLAAFCESEAGNQGLVGMEAVVLTVLNRTIKADREFPSSVRYVLYHGTTFPQYSVVTNGVLLKRLNGQFDNRELAYQAASEAMKIFNEYVTNGTKRTLEGINTKDFNYMYFMTISAYWKQPLNFSKVKSCQYKDHMFFVDWV